MENPLLVLITAIRLKAAVKTVKLPDLRFAIGIGDRTYQSERISECNGSAFIYSGEKFNLLKKEKQKMAIKSARPDFNAILNLGLLLGMASTD
jgi:hypothetical protein